MVVSVAAALAIVPQWTNHLRDSPADTDEAVTTRAHEALLKGDVAAAVAGFRRTVARDPASPYRWCDLAEALIESGEREEARQCVERAVASGPRIAAVLIRGANLSFRLGDRRRALEYDARALALVNDYDLPIFMTYTRMGSPVEEILEAGLPDQRSARQFFLYLARTGPAEHLEFAWRALRERGLAEDAAADRYAAYLVNAGLPARAAAVWFEQVGGREPGYRRSDWVFNGGFERDPAGEVFDWHFRKIAGASAARDTSMAAEGKSSLRIGFDGQYNLTYNQVSQRLVAPAGEYTFRASIRAEGITTNQGIGFRIRSDVQPVLDIWTDTVRGTTEWEELVASVTVQGTRVLEIQVARSPSGKFDNKLRGTVWVDAVKLERTQGQD